MMMIVFGILEYVEAANYSLHCEFHQVGTDQKQRFDTLEQSLQYLGEQGWELGASTINNDVGDGMLIFQRPSEIRR